MTASAAIYPYGAEHFAPPMEVGRRLCLVSIPALPVQRRHPEGELIKNLLLTTPPRTWRRRAGSQLMTFETTVRADLEPHSGRRVFGHARWRKDWVKISSELVRDRQPWNASVQEVMYSLCDDSSTHLSECRHKCVSVSDRHIYWGQALPA